MADNNNDDLKSRMDQAMGRSTQASKESEAMAQSEAMGSLSKWQKESLATERERLVTSQKKLETLQKEANLAGEAAKSNQLAREMLKGDIALLESKVRLKQIDADTAKDQIEVARQALALAEKSGAVAERSRGIVSGMADLMGVQNTGAAKYLKTVKEVLASEEERAKVNAEIVEQIRESFHPLNIGVYQCSP